MATLGDYGRVGEPPAPPADSDASLLGNTSAWQVATIVLAIVAAGLLAGVIVLAVTNDDGGSGGGNNNGEECIYSDKAMADVVDSATAYWRTVAPASVWFFAGQPWSLVPVKAQTLNFGTDQASLAANPMWVDGVALRADIDNLIDSGKISGLEIGKLRVTRVAVDLVVELTELGFFHSAYSSTTYFSFAPPYFSDFFVGSTLPVYASEPDYDQVVVEYMANLAAEYPNYVQYYRDVLATGASPAPAVGSARGASSWAGFLGFLAAVNQNDAACAAMTNATLQADCFAASATIFTQRQEMSNMWNTEWLPACQTYRSDSTPGLGQVVNGSEAYQEWLNYRNAFFITPAEVESIGVAARDEIIGNINDIIGAAYPGEGFAEWSANASDPNNDDYWMCTDDVNELATPFWNDLRNISRYMNVEIGERGSAYTDIVYGGDGGGAFYVRSAWDSTKAVWNTAGEFTFTSNENANGTACVPRFNMALTLHEADPGHGVNTQMFTQIQCDFNPSFVSRTTSYIEGYAHEKELACFELPISSGNPSPLATTPKEIAACWGDRLLRADRLIVDPGLQVFGDSLQDCIDFLQNDGFSPTDSTAQCVRYVENYAQATGYLLGSDIINNLRMQTMAELAADYDPRLFNQLFNKFGNLPFEGGYNDIVATFIVYTRDGRDAAKDLPYFDTIDEQLFRAGPALIGKQRNVPESGAIVVNKLTNENVMAATMAAAEARNDGSAHYLQQIVGAMTRVSA